MVHWHPLRFLILFCSLFLVSLQAKTLHAHYRVEYGILGKVADVNVTLNRTKSGYTIEAYVAAYGSLAKMVTENLHEHHISKGSIKHHLLVTDTYTMHKTYGVYKSQTKYIRKGRYNKVYKRYKRWKHNRLELSQHYRLNYRASDDLLSFFLNLPSKLKEKKPGASYHFRVIGADRKAGLVTVRIPLKREHRAYERLLGKLQKQERYIKVIMYRKLYGSKQGELEVRIDQTGIVCYAVLEDLLFFGDVRIILEKLW